MYTVSFEFKVGEKVWDDLTKKESIVIGITYSNGKKSKKDLTTACNTIGYWVDNDYLGGGRHPWELSKIIQEGNNVRIS